MVLTEEQRARMAENKRLALQKRLKTDTKVPIQGVACSFQSTSDGKTEPRSLISKSDTNVVPNVHVHKRKLQGSCVLVSLDRFEVEIGYDEQVVSTLKSFKSARYEASRRLWSLQVADHNGLLQSLAKLKPNIVVEPLPQWILDTFLYQKNKDEDNNLDSYLEKLEGRVEATLLDQLMPFQRQGVAFGLKNEARVLLADDMGLGKTIQALGMASMFRAEWPLLIVCPSSLRFSWREAVVRWIVSVPEEDIFVVTSGKDKLYGSQVVIVSYDLMSKHEYQLESLSFKVAILDESHYLKNYKSNRTRSASRVVKKANRLMLLSGTPALSRPMELYSQLSLLRVKHLPNAVQFGMRYCDGKKIFMGNSKDSRCHYNFSGCSNMQELKLLLQRMCLLRRLKSEVLSQLPSKQRQLIILDPNRLKNKSSMTKHSLNLDKHKQCSSAKRRGLLLEWFNATAETKCQAVGDYIKEMIDNSDEKIICFAHHITMLDHLTSVIESTKVGYVRIDGATSSSLRHEFCSSFQTDDKVRVAVLSITAANTGLTLTAAQLVVFAELFWNPGMLCQAEDRAHRIGQTDCVVVQYLVAKGTADDHLWPLLQKKLQVLNKAGLSKDDFSESICASSTKSTTTAQNEDNDDWMLGDDDILLLDLCASKESSSSAIASTNSENTETPRKRSKLM